MNSLLEIFCDVDDFCRCLCGLIAYCRCSTNILRLGYLYVLPPKPNSCLLYKLVLPSLLKILPHQHQYRFRYRLPRSGIGYPRDLLRHLHRFGG
jgi:hypothetical protein